MRRVQTVRAACPDVWIGFDANQGYVPETYMPLQRALRDVRVSLLELPCRRGREVRLDGIERLLPLAADESVLSLAEIDAQKARFVVINIKLDECRGWTEGLLMVERARGLGLKVIDHLPDFRMVGHARDDDSRSSRPSQRPRTWCW